jgi:hypothetical protein
VLFDPDVYPANWAFWNGKVTRHWHEDEHPLEHDAVDGNGEAVSPAVAPSEDGVKVVKK